MKAQTKITTDKHTYLFHNVHTKTDHTAYQQLKRIVNYPQHGKTGVGGAGTGNICSYTPTR